MTATTVMRDSLVGDDWIRQVCAANPVQMLSEGHLSTGAVRLAFTDTLITPKTQQNNPQGPAKYSVMSVFPPYADMSIFYAEYYRILGASMPEYYVPELKSYQGVESPFHDQATKLKYAGMTPGLVYISHNSKFRPKIVDVQKNIITDASRVYPGVWAILVVNAYPYGKNPPQPKKGVAFGLEAVMLIGDDKPLAGGGVDPNVVFKNVSVPPPTFTPQVLQTMVPGGGIPTGAPPVPMGAPPGAPGSMQGVPQPPMPAGSVPPPPPLR
jgi:hypothetical protein